VYSPSGRKPEIKIVGPLPESLDIVLANQIYINYVDSNVPILTKMYDRRLKGYHSIGYEIEDD